MDPRTPLGSRSIRRWRRCARDSPTAGLEARNPDRLFEQAVDDVVAAFDLVVDQGVPFGT
jgi:hypothetical protein